MLVIPGYEGYAIDIDGNVYSLNYKRTGEMRMLKPCINGRGYNVIALRKDGKTLTHAVHRLYAQAYLPDYSEDLQVDHIDCDRTNNDLNNLRMVTSQQNNFNRKKVKGVCFDKQAKKWRARIMVNGRYISLGYYDTKQEAREVYLHAKEYLHNIPREKK